MSRHLILSHAADLDGVGSAALLAHCVPAQDFDDTAVVFADNDDRLDKLAQAIRSYKPDVVWISDLSFHAHEFQEASTILRDIESVCFFDHHGPSADFFARVRSEMPNAQVFFDASGNSCAADLIYNNPPTSNPDAFEWPAWLEDLRRFTHSADLFLNAEENGKLLSMAISILGAEAMFNLLMADSQNAYSDTYCMAIRVAVDRCRQQDQKSWELVNWTTTTVSLTDLPESPNLVLCLSSGNESVIGNITAEKYSPAWTVMIKPDSFNVSMRTNDATIALTGISVQDIALQFHGGGHPRAAGFPLPLEWVYGGLDRARTDLVAALSEIHANKSKVLA